MKKLAVLVLIAAFAFVNLLLADDNFSYDDYNHAFGTKLSNISGYGIYYSYKATPDFRIQFMGLPWFSSNSNETYYGFDSGLELQRDLYRSKTVRFYMLAGAYYYKQIDKYEKDNDYVLNLMQVKRELDQNSYNGGIGFTFEYQWNRFCFAFDFGYKYFEDNYVITVTEQNGTIHQYPQTIRKTKAGGGFGVGFIF